MGVGLNMIVGEFQCAMCYKWRLLKDFAFSFEVDGEDEGVCGWCAGCYD
jgi:hypothetical protein